MAYWYILILINLLFSQQFLDEMKIIDISNDADVKSTLIRDPQQALLVVKTQIPDIRIQSNNKILKTVETRSGVWHIRLAPGTHRISFQAAGFIAVQQRFYFHPKDVKGVNIRVIPAMERLM